MYETDGFCGIFSCDFSDVIQPRKIEMSDTVSEYGSAEADAAGGGLRGSDLLRARHILDGAADTDPSAVDPDAVNRTNQADIRTIRAIGKRNPTALKSLGYRKPSDSAFGSYVEGFQSMLTSDVDVVAVITWAAIGPLVIAADRTLTRRREAKERLKRDNEERASARRRLSKDKPRAPFVERRLRQPYPPGLSPDGVNNGPQRPNPPQLQIRGAKPSGIT